MIWVHLNIIIVQSVVSLDLSIGAEYKELENIGLLCLHLLPNSVGLKTCPILIDFVVSILYEKIPFPGMLTYIFLSISIITQI